MKVVSVVVSAYAFAIAAAGCGLVTYSQDTEKSISINTAELCDDLMSNDYRKRLGACIALEESRKQLGEKLVNVFMKSTGNESHDSKYLAIFQMGYWRLEETIGFLLANIEWEIRGGGHEKPENAYYPCIRALERIGGRQVGVALEERICKTREERALRLLCWTYARVAGREAAASQIKKFIDGIEDEEQKQACRKALTYIEKYESLIRELR